MKSKISKILSIFLLIAVLFCEFAPVTAVAASKISKKIKLDGYGLSKTSITIYWETEYDYDYYLVYRAKDKGSYKKVAKVTKTSYKDKKLKTSSTYSYKVVGVDGKTKNESNTIKLNTIKRGSPYVYQSDRSHAILEWSYPKSQLSSITEFLIYRRAEGESYTKIGTLSKKAYLTYLDNEYSYSFFDTDSKKVGKKYYYRVIPCNGSKRGTSETVELTIEPYIYLSTAKKEIKMKWTAFPKATKYKVYADIYKISPDGYFEFYKTKRLTTKEKGDSLSYTLSGVNTNKYVYYIYVKAYRTTKKSKKAELLYTYYSVSSESPYSLMRDAASKKSNDNYDVISYRGTKKTLAWAAGITAADKKIMADFAKLHFQSGMSKTEKALYVHSWIHYNNNYDYDYSTSGKYSYVKCIFEEQEGQCLQYNGALVEYLNYLGFEARLIQGYRYQNAGHFWGEIKVAGRWYCMETGTYKKDGPWQHFCERYGPYGNAINYNICGEIT